MCLQSAYVVSQHCTRPCPRSCTCAGRSSFPRCVTVALRLGWKVEMYAWRASMSICYPAFAALSRGRMTIRYLDEWRADVGATDNPQPAFVHP